LLPESPVTKPEISLENKAADPTPTIPPQALSPDHKFNGADSRSSICKGLLGLNVLTKKKFRWPHFRTANTSYEAASTITTSLWRLLLQCGVMRNSRHGHHNPFHHLPLKMDGRRHWTCRLYPRRIRTTGEKIERMRHGAKNLRSLVAPKQWCDHRFTQLNVLTLRCRRILEPSRLYGDIKDKTRRVCIYIRMKSSSLKYRPSDFSMAILRINRDVFCIYVYFYQICAAVVFCFRWRLSTTTNIPPL